MSEHKPSTEENENLFHLGMKSNIKIVGGWILTFLGLCGLFTIPVVGVIFLAFGLYLIYKGKKQHYDYRRKSGIIVHKE
jgi:hypothetical protein